MGIWVHKRWGLRCIFQSSAQVFKSIRLDLCPWDSPGKNNGVGFHFLLQGIFLPRVKPESPVSLALQVDSVPVESPGKATGREWRTWLIGDAPTFRHKPRGKWENQGGRDFWRSWSWFNTKENEGPKGSWVSRSRQGIVASDAADKQGADTCPLSWQCVGCVRKASHCPAGPWQAQVQWGQGCRLQVGDLMRELEIRK